LIDGNAGKKVACCVVRGTQSQFLPSGARCERDSPTSERPKCAIEHECCGSASIMEGEAVKHTFEICHGKEQENYPYYSEMGAAKVDLPFTCFPEELANKLSATITAFGVAAYMMM
jgi:hypothetical protein